MPQLLFCQLARWEREGHTKRRKKEGIITKKISGGRNRVYAKILFCPDDPPGFPAYNVGAAFGKSEYRITLNLGGFPAGTILAIGEKHVRVLENNETQTIDK